MAASSPTLAPTGADDRTVRAVSGVFRGQATADGAGVRLTRVIGGPAVPDLDPFLLLDEFGSDDPSAYIAGFPDHPHRGFETVTYMLAGRMRHRDNRGNEGLLGPGAVQWMTAGRGIVHSEMPEQQQGLMRGFQLWLNLPAAEKLRPAEYRDIAPSAIPVLPLATGGEVRVIAGEYAGRKGPAPERATAPLYLDVALPAGASFAVDVPAAQTAFLYVYEGSVQVGGTTVGTSRLATLSHGARIEFAALGAPARVLVVAATPLGEPVARYGPFVMTTPDEIEQALEDYRAGRL
jgi:quercetin 2,3-dioxygenase